LKAPSDGNTRIRTKLNAWVEGLERLDGDPFDKFDSTVQTMVNNAPQFAEKIRTASPEHRDTLLEVGGFVKRAIGRLADNVRGVAGKLAADAVRTRCPVGTRAVDGNPFVYGFRVGFNARGKPPERPRDSERAR